MNKETIGREIGVLVAQGLDVPKFLKNVPIFFENVTRIP